MNKMFFLTFLFVLLLAKKEHHIDKKQENRENSSGSRRINFLVKYYQFLQSTFWCFIWGTLLKNELYCTKFSYSFGPLLVMLRVTPVSAIWHHFLHCSETQLDARNWITDRCLSGRALCVDNLWSSPLWILHDECIHFFPLNSIILCLKLLRKCSHIFHIQECITFVNSLM